MTENKTPCKWCGTICNHDDDAYNECRFCHQSARNADGSPKHDDSKTCQENVGEITTGGTDGR